MNDVECVGRGGYKECITFTQHVPAWDKFAQIHTELFLLLFGYCVLVVLVFLIIKVSQEAERSSATKQYIAETERLQVEHDYELEKLIPSKDEE